MSKNEILHELVKLSAEERSEVRTKLDELDGLSDDEWDDDGELSIDERRLILERIADLERDPNIGIPWEEVKADLQKRFGK